MASSSNHTTTTTTAPPPEKTLRESFCGAANHLTQLYIMSLRQEKLAFKKGYCDAMEEVMRWLEARGANNDHQHNATLRVDSIKEFIRSRTLATIRDQEQEIVGLESVRMGVHGVAMPPHASAQGEEEEAEEEAEEFEEGGEEEEEDEEDEGNAWLEEEGPKDRGRRSAKGKEKRLNQRHNINANIGGTTANTFSFGGGAATPTTTNQPFNHNRPLPPTSSSSSSLVGMEHLSLHGTSSSTSSASSSSSFPSSSASSSAAFSFQPPQQVQQPSSSFSSSSTFLVNSFSASTSPSPRLQQQQRNQRPHSRPRTASSNNRKNTAIPKKRPFFDLLFNPTPNNHNTSNPFEQSDASSSSAPFSPFHAVPSLTEHNEGEGDPADAMEGCMDLVGNPREWKKARFLEVEEDPSPSSPSPSPVASLSLRPKK
ncbi:Myelin transcription factor 1-like, a [Balamuthia mandrillaris]